MRVNASLIDYHQPDYANVSFPENLQDGWSCIQKGIRKTSIFIDESIQVPNLIFRVFQLGVMLLANSPTVDVHLEMPKQLCKDTKNIFNILKGFKSIDGVVHFKCVVKLIILNVSGLTLLFVSGISLIDRFKILNVSVVKIALAAIPVLGVLPFGGLLPLSIIGLLGTTMYMSLERRMRLSEKETSIRNHKFAFWSQLDFDKIQQKIVKYESKIVPVKSAQWNRLARDWKKIDPLAIENFRQAKMQKWQAKLDQIELDKHSILLSLISNITIVSRQAFMVGAVLSGFGMLAIPFFVNLGFDVLGASCDFGNFFLKRHIRQINIPAVDMSSYFALDN